MMRFPPSAVSVCAYSTSPPSSYDQQAENVAVCSVFIRKKALRIDYRSARCAHEWRLLMVVVLTFVSLQADDVLRRGK